MADRFSPTVLSHGVMILCKTKHSNARIHIVSFGAGLTNSSWAVWRDELHYYHAVEVLVTRSSATKKRCLEHGRLCKCHHKFSMGSLTESPGHRSNTTLEWLQTYAVKQEKK